MSEIILGNKVKESKVDELKSALNNLLESDEVIKGVFKASRLRPVMDFMVITSARMLCVWSSKSDSEKGYVYEINGEEFKGVATNDKKPFMGQRNLVVVNAQDKEQFVGDVRVDDYDDIVRLLDEMKGSVTTIVHRMLNYRNTPSYKQEVMTREQEESIKARQITERQRQAMTNTTTKTYITNCPRCDSDKLQAVQDVHTTGFSAINGTAGCCCLGPLGLLCGLFGSGQTKNKTRRMCLNCGKKF